MRLCTRLRSFRSFFLALALCGVASAVHAAVPTPWLAQDVGAPSPAGSSTYNSGTFTINASGWDIWGSSDQFHFVYQQVSGDFSVSARVDSVVNTNVWAKAGVMIRTSLAANSAYALAAVTPGSGVTFLQRASAGASSTNTTTVGGAAPRWVRLVRTGTTITAAMSADGSQWTTLSTSTVSLGSSVYVGLAVSSHATGVLTTANISNVSLSAASGGSVPSPQKDSDIGAPAITGSTSYNAGQYTIKAGGVDIWNTSDEFHYVYQPLSGDAEIVARVAGIGASDAWAKAGVMVRETLAADARHADAFLTAANGNTFQRRIDPSGVTVGSSGFSGTAPGWVRLVRTGYKFDAYYSTDGQTWTSMGSDTVPMTDPVYVGLAVTSHNATVGTTAVIDSLKITPGSAPNNQPPTVTLTSPTSGSSFTAPATVSLSATASDPENRMSHVDFYAGTTLLVSDTAAPYTFTWSSVPAGTYAVKAIAYDADGGSTSSAVATVTVSGTTTNQPPTVTLTSPASGTTAAAPATVTLSANASDPEGRMARVEFYNGSTLLNSDTTAPYSYTWSSVPAGTYSLKAVAYDQDGGVTSSAVSTVTVTGGTTTVQPAFVQNAYLTPQSPVSTVAVKYANAQSAGNLNVVVIGWSDAASHVTSVKDSAGNVYAQALAPVVLPGSETQTIYYAANIAAAAAGANTVTITFDAAVPYPDVRIAEYKGIATANPVEAAASASGNSASSSGSITTASANDLVIAGNTVESSTASAGSGFTSRVITSPDGNILEDRVAPTAGGYTASAGLSYSAGWVMQVVAFRAASGGSSTGDTQAPTAPTGVTASAASSAQVNLTWTASTDNVGVASYVVERCQGSGCTSFAQTGTSATTNYSVTGLSASTNYSFRVRAMDAAGNVSGYSAVATATTTATADTQAPTAPTGVVATASGTQVTLTWTAATDNVGVTGYLVERCQGSGCTSFAQVGTPSGVTFNDTTGLTAGTTYSYRVRAKDGAGNLGPYSTVATATTQSATAAPKTVAFTASPDHSTSMVTGYTLNVYAAGANPATATPIATSDLAKPAPDSTNTITVDQSTFFSGLASGSYVATVSAYGPGGSTASTSVTFAR